MRKSSGFTLIEMLVTIAAASLVLFATSSFLLTGLRLEADAGDTLSAQRDSRVALTMLENIAAEGKIDKIEYTNSDWVIIQKNEENEEYETILHYDFMNQTINGKGGGVIMDEVYSSEVSYDDGNGLLKCSITNASGESYSTSVYCRVGTVESNGVSVEELITDTETEKDKLDKISTPTPKEEEQKARYAFLVTLLSQYGSTGKIVNDTGSPYNGLYYSRWYALVNDYEEFLEWGRETAWCACFTSWGLAKVIGEENTVFASVPYTMWGLFDMPQTVDNFPSTYSSDGYSASRKIGDFEPSKTGDGVHAPVPGDLVFFERGDGDSVPDHIGCVLYVDNGRVYTIEGNNNNRVGIFSYSLDPDEDIKNNSEMYIVGYGQINWDKYIPAT